jgi:diguanylate cyclase (GGDEF)-like protein
MIMLDIDNFKRINDTHGHHVGDIALREVASIVAQTIRTTDYCARYGGEDFAILLPHTEHKKAVALAERIRKKVAVHTFLMDGDTPLNLTASLGVSSLTSRSMKNRQALICEADAALYAAKKNGKNRVCLSPQVETAELKARQNAC